MNEKNENGDLKIELTKREYDLLKYVVPTADPRPGFLRVLVRPGELVSTNGQKLIVLKKEHEAKSGFYWLAKTSSAKFRNFLFFDKAEIFNQSFPNIDSLIERVSKDFVGEFDFTRRTDSLSAILFKVYNKGVCIDFNLFYRLPAVGELFSLYAEPGVLVRFKFSDFDFYIMPVKVDSEIPKRVGV